MFVSTTIASGILALAGHALALPSTDRRAANVVPTSVWESIQAAPVAWTKDDSDADADEVLELRIQLKQQNIAQFQQLALDVCESPLLYITCTIFGQDMNERPLKMFRYGGYQKDQPKEPWLVQGSTRWFGSTMQHP